MHRRPRTCCTQSMCPPRHATCTSSAATGKHATELLGEAPNGVGRNRALGQEARQPAVARQLYIHGLQVSPAGRQAPCRLRSGNARATALHRGRPRVVPDATVTCAALRAGAVVKQAGILHVVHAPACRSQPRSQWLCSICWSGLCRQGQQPISRRRFKHEDAAEQLLPIAWVKREARSGKVRLHCGTCLHPAAPAPASRHCGRPPCRPGHPQECSGAGPRAPGAANGVRLRPGLCGTTAGCPASTRMDVSAQAVCPGKWGITRSQKRKAKDFPLRTRPSPTVAVMWRPCMCALLCTLDLPQHYSRQ